MRYVYWYIVVEISQYSSFGGMFLGFRSIFAYFGVSKMKGLPTLSSTLWTLEITNLGSVPTSISIVEVAEAEWMVLFLVLAADSNSACVGTRRRYLATLWLWNGDRTRLELREDAVALIFGVRVTTGMLGADGTGYLKDEGNEKGGGIRFAGKTDG